MDNYIFLKCISITLGDSKWQRGWCIILEDNKLGNRYTRNCPRLRKFLVFKSSPLFYITPLSLGITFLEPNSTK